MTQSSVIARPPRAVYKCGHCHGYIVVGETEVDMRVYVKDGMPICAKCRIMRSNAGNRIRADRSKLNEDLYKQKQLKEKNEDARVVRLAIESQDDAPRIADIDRRFTI